MDPVTSGVPTLWCFSDLSHKTQDMSIYGFALTMGCREGFGDNRDDRIARELESPKPFCGRFSTRRMKYEGSHYSDHRN